MNWYTYAGFADEIDMDIRAQIDGFKEIGMRYIELRGVNGKNISEISVEEAREIKKLMENEGFGVSAIGSPVGKTEVSAPNTPEVEKLRHIIRLAEIFETRYVRVFSPFLPEEDAPEKHRDTVMRRMQEYVDAARGMDVLLLHENEGGYIYGQAPENCRDIVETIGSAQLKVIFDPGNFVYAGFDALEAYHILKPYIEHVHIKDSAGKDSVVPAGNGKVQYVEILRELKKLDRHFFLTHEPHLADCAALAAVDNNSFEKMEGTPTELFRLAYDNFEKIMRRAEKL